MKNRQKYFSFNNTKNGIKKNPNHGKCWFNNNDIYWGEVGDYLLFSLYNFDICE